MTQTAKLTSSFSGAGFGGCAAIDGNTIVVGGGAGHAFLFVEPNSGWTNSTQTAELSLPDGSESSSVGVSGNTAVVGYPFADDGSPYSQGAAYVFVEPAKGWKTMGPTATLTAADNGNENWMGWSVAMQGDQIFAGSPGTTVNGKYFRGAIYGYTKPSTGWQTTSQFDSKTIASQANPNPGELGWSVAYGGDVLVAGAPYGGQGAAYVFAP
jgi:hypothetical protein